MHNAAHVYMAVLKPAVPMTPFSNSLHVHCQLQMIDGACGYTVQCTYLEFVHTVHTTHMELVHTVHTTHMGVDTQHLGGTTTWLLPSLTPGQTPSLLV